MGGVTSPLRGRPDPLTRAETTLRRVGVVPPGTRLTSRGWVAVVAVPLVLLLLLTTALVRDDGPSTAPRRLVTVERPVTYVVLEAIQGVATVYGPGMEGNLTANGEAFDMTDPTTAAHPDLPFDTLVRVTNPATGAQQVVRINDRLPDQPRSRIDLTIGAGEAIGITIGSGPTDVLMEIVTPG